MFYFRRVTRSSNTPKKDGVIQFKGKELRLELRSRHERRTRGQKGKGAVSKEPDTIEFDDDKEEQEEEEKAEEMRSSISELLKELDDSDEEEQEETLSSKRPADDDGENDDRCPKKSESRCPQSR